jgi:hypothetical protein
MLAQAFRNTVTLTIEPRNGSATGGRKTIGRPTYGQLVTVPLSKLCQSTKCLSAKRFSTKCHRTFKVMTDVREERFLNLWPRGWTYSVSASSPAVWPRRPIWSPPPAPGSGRRTTRPSRPTAAGRRVSSATWRERELALKVEAHLHMRFHCPVS